MGPGLRRDDIGVVCSAELRSHLWSAAARYASDLSLQLIQRRERRLRIDPVFAAPPATPAPSASTARRMVDDVAVIAEVVGDLLDRTEIVEPHIGKLRQALRNDAP